jgi:hypothetical protein
MVETCRANKVRKNLIALVLVGVFAKTYSPKTLYPGGIRTRVKSTMSTKVIF